METKVRQDFPPPAPSAPLDAVMQERLARLSASRGTREAPTATGRTTPPTGRTRKRHAAKRSRAAAVVMSITTATNTSPTLANGTYTGATATNKWGPVQVQITVAGGKITEVVALQTPTADRKSVSINARATPTLASEALAAQSANIHTVSGATYTSDSYKVSLQSAIDLAQSTVLQASTAP